MSTNVNARAKYLLNKMNSVASDIQLGTVLEAIDDQVANPVADGAVTKAKLAAGVKPSHMVVYAGTATTVGGGASEDITVAGCLATDMVMCQIKTPGATPRTLNAAKAKAGDGAITLTFSGDPSNDHVVQYFVFRATS